VQQVVIGTQSSGKSSLINSLTGFDLMPTGSGMVTQAPLRLILQHSASDDLVVSFDFWCFTQYAHMASSESKLLRTGAEWPDDQRLQRGRNTRPPPLFLG